jgi:hypothetical protein
LKTRGGGLSAATISDDFVVDLLAFSEAREPRLFDSADVDENVRAAVVGLNEAEAFLRVKPFDCARSHIDSPSSDQKKDSIQEVESMIIEIFWEKRKLHGTVQSKFIGRKVR